MISVIIGIQTFAMTTTMVFTLYIVIKNSKVKMESKNKRRVTS